MPSPAVLLSCRNLLQRFRRNRSGATFVEFALVAPLFLGLLAAIVETALLFFANQVLENVTQNSTRMILTGQVQLANYTKDNFRDYVCNGAPSPLPNPPPGPSPSLYGLFDCTKLSIDVEAYKSFQTINLNSQLDGSGNFINNMQFNAGGPGDIVVVRIFYPWQLYITKLGFNLANMAGDQRLLVATAAVKNEPYN